MRLLAIGLVVAVPLVLGAILVAAGARRPAPAPSEAAEAARRHSAAVNALALTCLFGAVLVGSAVLTALPPGGSQGVYLGLMPAAAGIAFAAVQAAGELAWPRPTGMLRRAPLTRRTAVDVAPRWLRRLTWSWAALVAVTVVVCGLVSDDGRGIARTFANGSASAGPFPGWFYGVPLLVATVAVLLAAEGVLRLVARRPAVMDTAPEWDLGLRRISAHRLLRGAQLVLGWTASGVVLVAGAAVHSVGLGGAINGVSVGSPGYAGAGIALLLLGGAIGLASVVTMFLPGLPLAASPATEPSLGTVPA